MSTPEKILRSIEEQLEKFPLLKLRRVLVITRKVSKKAPAFRHGDELRGCVVNVK